MDTFFKDFNNIFLGLGGMINEINEISRSNSTFPPFNIIQNEDKSIIIELAVAGFKQTDLNVELIPGEQNILVVEGSNKQADENDYICKGIATRPFKKKWKMTRYYDVNSVKYDAGILRILCKYNVPDELKPKTFKIE